MRGQERNKQGFWYCLLDPTVEHAIIDANGNETGEIIPHYEDAVLMKANISPATGQSQAEMFGDLDNYDKVIVTCDMSCPIDEHSVLFIDKAPEYTNVTTHVITPATALYGTDTITPVVYSQPKYDYIVKRVARSLNSISIAVRKVEVG